MPNWNSNSAVPFRFSLFRAELLCYVYTEITFNITFAFLNLFIYVSKDHPLMLFIRNRSLDILQNNVMIHTCLHSGILSLFTVVRYSWVQCRHSGTRLHYLHHVALIYLYAWNWLFYHSVCIKHINVHIDDIKYVRISTIHCGHVAYVLSLDYLSRHLYVTFRNDSSLKRRKHNMHAPIFNTIYLVH